MPDFLLELRSEEIPARMQAGARAELEKLLRRELDAAGVATGEITVWSTPRRLALIARDLPTATQAVSEEAKGPPEGAPDQAIDGFCRKQGVTRDQLTLRDVKGRNTWLAVVEKPGRAVTALLAEAIPAIIRDFSWPKSMRWGAASLRSESLRWVRPLSGIVALLGEELVECELHGVTSGRVTLGHRFHHSGDITIGGADDYAEKLRACHVIVDHEERAALIRAGAQQIAAEAGLELVADEGLVVENAGLTEWPVPLLGRFDASFLDVPPEVIQLTARVNQKYFVCQDEAGKLANAFICTANIAGSDGGAAIVDGNRKVLAARLSDARFFWEQDRKTPLAEQAKKLERITFHEKLGSVADKVERVAKLARWLVETDVVVPAKAGTSPAEGPDLQEIPASAGMTKEELADLAEQAARLAKADLVTEMVGEFPELQGLMGGYYARAEGLPDEVADAIRDHYKPVGQGDEVPTAPVTVAVSLADKLDTLAGFFSIDERPTGSKDPFALRRAALGVIGLVRSNELRASMYDLFFAALPEHEGREIGRVGAADYLNDFFVDRLKVQQRDEGTRHDLIDAVAFMGGDDGLGGERDIVRLLARVHALQAYVETDDGANLLGAYKRASNILKKENYVTPAKAGVSGDGDQPGQMPASAGMMDSGSDTGGIPQTGEEDPFALVDDPDFKGVNDAILAAHNAKTLSYTPEPAEDALIQALASAEPAAATAVAAEDFAAAMAALASLRAPIDRFFEEVTVNDDSKPKRAARLDLLARFRAAVHTVADFSRIEG